MQILKGDLWDYHRDGWKIVISTNIGWTERRPIWDGERADFGEHMNNMGAGIALQAWQRWRWLSNWLGEHYRARHLAGLPQLPVEHDQLRLIFVPVKPLKVADPAYSWNQKASEILVATQLRYLDAHQGDIALGFIGCGNGALPQDKVLPHLLGLEIRRAHIGHGKTLVVDREAA